MGNLLPGKGIGNCQTYPHLPVFCNTCSSPGFLWRPGKAETRHHYPGTLLHRGRCDKHHFPWREIFVVVLLVGRWEKGRLLGRQPGPLGRPSLKHHRHVVVIIITIIFWCPLSIIVFLKYLDALLYISVACMVIPRELIDKDHLHLVGFLTMKYYYSVHSWSSWILRLWPFLHTSSIPHQNGITSTAV